MRPGDIERTWLRRIAVASVYPFAVLFNMWNGAKFTTYDLIACWRKRA